ncbi:MAG: M28 family peptidase [Lachnospiraceae bacterium]|jgi:hypothetical protein|nr:M28 family peptidase [Lachnospiraceae bacterium]
MKKLRIQGLLLAAAMAAALPCCGKTSAGAQTPADVSAEEMQKTLDAVCAQERFSGSDGEKAAVNYLEGRFREQGLSVTEQAVTAQPYISYPTFKGGMNVIAVRAADQTASSKASDAPDILIVSAHHDSMPCTVGADDNASGVTALVELARVLKSVPSDTEIRFVSFTGEEEGRVGSRFYVNSLSREERDRVIGDIQIDMLGYHRDYDTVLSTVDGRETLLGDLLTRQSDVFSLTCEKDAMSDHFSFYNGGIPAVMVSQDRIGYENHTVQDRPDTIDTKKLEAPVAAVAKTMAGIMSADTASYLEESRKISPSDTEGMTSTVGRRDPLYIGTERAMFDDLIGQDGVDEGQRDDDLYGSAEIYKYMIRWFGMEEPIETEAVCVEDSIRRLDILAAKAGYTQEEIMKYLTDESADPTMSSNSDGTVFSYSWYEKDYGKLYTLMPGKNDTDYDLTVESMTFGTDVLREVQMTQDDAALVASLHDARQRKIAGYAVKIIPPEYRSTVVLTFFTDGVGNELGYTQNYGDSNEKMSWGIDVGDFFNADGSFRSLDKSIQTMVHEFGHVLFENSTQVDMTKQGDLPQIWYPEETYTDTSYTRRFYDAFVKGTELDGESEGQGYSFDYYFAHPTEFTDQYAGENAMKEDMAETFAVFVLTDTPDSSDTSGAAAKIRFFADDPEMSRIRTYIRSSLGLD